ncbi:hypothetical protein [Streptomyces sp. NPDC086519]|uniref:hypothetical protein n=1 Tax=Streptomyces sp. NPDC086519 TaxID=3154863 RepID=UPI00342D50F7
MNTGTAPRSAQNTADVTDHSARATAGWRQRRVLGLAAAAGLIVLGGGVAAGIMAPGGNGRTSAAGPPTLVAAPGSAGAKCAEPVPDRLRRFPTLFVGTVAVR